MTASGWMPQPQRPACDGPDQLHFQGETMSDFITLSPHRPPAPQAAPPPSLRIGAAIFLPVPGFLIIGTQQKGLRPKTADVLKLLLENQGRMVPREELLQKVWPDLGVTDDNLTQSIGEIRRALGPGLAGLLKTVQGRGYILSSSAAMDPAPQAAPAASAADAMMSPVPTGEPYESRVRQLELRVVQLERLLNPGRGIKRDMASSE
jgi:DNA-binding winged helix-turn-helix (wHTH) protein